jgi:hypothetical protein
LIENYDLSDLKYKIKEEDEEEPKIEKQKKITKQKKTQKQKKVILDDEGIIENKIDLPDYIWQYEDGGFCNYDLAASNEVEIVYQQWLKNPGDFDVRSVKSGAFHYMVDFRKMTQMNVDHENHTMRNIRRVKTNQEDQEEEEK